MSTGVSAELIARFREKKFVADKRCSGWWTTNLCKYIGNVLVVPSDEYLLLCTVRESLKRNVFCRWRIYYHNMRFMQLSVREEDVDRIYEALQCTIKHALPKSEHFSDNTIYWENIPHYKDLFDLTNAFLSQNDARKVLGAPVGETRDERLQYTKLVDTLDHIAKRFIGDFPDRRVRDVLLKRMFQTNLAHLRPSQAETRWLNYQNIWALSEKIDEISPRTEKEAGALFKYYPITKRQFKEFHLEHPEELLETRRPKKIDDSQMIVPNNTTDNDLLRNIDVVRGRGMFLSTSTTYGIIKDEEEEAVVNVDVFQGRG